MNPSFRQQQGFQHQLEQQRKQQQQAFQMQSQQQLQSAMERQRQQWLDQRQQQMKYAARPERRYQYAPDAYEKKKPWLIFRIIGWVWMTFWRLVGLAIALGIIAVIIWFIVGVIR